MTSSLGHDTGDLAGRRTVCARVDLNAPHAPHDLRVLDARAKWFVVSGLALTALTIALAVVWDLGFDDDMPLAYALPLYFVSIGCLFVGCMEYLNRPTRVAQAEAIARVEHGMAKVVELLPVEMQQRYYKGQAAAYREVFGERTASDPAPARGTAEVVRLQRRNDRPR